MSSWRAQTLLDCLLRPEFSARLIYRGAMKTKAYVIARPEKLTQTKIQFLEDCDLEVVRVDPVFTTERFGSMTNREYGCYLAHKNVWELIQKNDLNAIVFEEDFEPVVDINVMKQTLERYKVGDNELIRLGHCGNYCTHAYMLSKKMAETLLSLSPQPSDHLFLHISNIKSVPYANFSKYFGEGIFQQNRVEQDDTAIHNINNIRHDQVL